MTKKELKFPKDFILPPAGLEEGTSKLSKPNLIDFFKILDEPNYI